MKDKYLIITGIVLITISFFIGRCTMQPQEIERIKYVKGDTITDTIIFDRPYKIIEPIDTNNIIQQAIKDGVFVEYKYVYEKVDTEALLKDWASKRLYDTTLFNSDTLGKCIVNAEIQYNKLRQLSYEYTPIQKEITIPKKIPMFEPFVGGGIAYPLGGYAEIGTFIHNNHGITVSVSTNKEYRLGYIYKF